MDHNFRQKMHQFLQHLSPTTDREMAEVSGQLRGVTHLLNQRGEGSLSASGLSWAQFRILMSLLFEEVIEGNDALNPSIISERHGTNRNTVSALIRALERDGRVKRTLDEHDRRKFNICLTDAGRDLVYQHSKEHFTALDSIFSVLDKDEVAEFGRILTKLRENLC